MYKRISSLLEDKKNQYQLGLGIVIMFYCVIYLTFLISTNFLPYVFDNNESFSCLIHAKNMFDFGVAKSFGLTDEAIGSLSAAHPYVYTHQGNFPRFYTLILYWLGLHKVESQLFVTIFTVGLAGIFFCYHFFSKHVSNLFACIFCMLLMTDYLMFAQWQVNLWRVWHLFFFFSSFLCCHGLINKYRKTFIFLSILNFACLFYLELTYAVFVFLSVSSYIFFQKVSLRVKFYNVIIISIGGLIGLSILVLQDIAFLGWNNFILDLNYTYNARIQISKSELGRQQILNFFAQKQIVFWQNFNSLEGLRNPKTFLYLFYRYCMLPYTPFITVSACIVTLSSLMSYWSEPNNKPGYFFSESPKNNLIFKLISGLFLFLSLLALTYISYPTMLGKFAYAREISKACSLVSIISFLLFISLTKHDKSRQGETISFFVLVIILSIIFYKLSLFTQDLSPALNTIIEKALDGKSWYPFIFGTLLLFLAPIYRQDSRYTKNQNEIVQKLIPYVFSTAIGFFAAYLLLPGYIKTAYWNRYCCFSVFAHLTLYAWLFYTLSSYPIHFWLREMPKIGEHTIQPFSTYFKLFAALFLLFIFSFCWLFLQKTYIRVFPANHYQQLIHALRDKYFFKRPFIANNYAAPYAYINNSWGYFDPDFGQSKLNKEGSNFQFQNNTSYLWFADGNINPIYKHPFFYLCFLNYNFDELGGNYYGCGNISIIQAIRDNKGKLSGLKELRRDTSTHDKWAIIQIHDDP